MMRYHTQAPAISGLSARPLVPEITNEENLEFANDEEAIVAVDSLKTGRAMELWKGGKRIKVFPLILKEGR